jgi:hypothetical protein
VNFEMAAFEGVEGAQDVTYIRTHCGKSTTVVLQVLGAKHFFKFLLDSKVELKFSKVLNCAELAQRHKSITKTPVS